MRDRPVALALSLSLFLSLGGAAEAATPAAKRCTAKGAKTVVKNRYARVFTADGPGRSDDADVYRRLYGCMYSTGRRVLLTVAYDDELYTAGNFSSVRLDGRFVAWQYDAVDVSCKADCPPDYSPLRQTINIADLRSRQQESVAGSARPGTLAVDRRGTATWLDEATGEPRSATLR